MEEKLKKEKEEAEAEKNKVPSDVTDIANENENEVEEQPSESVDKPTAVESLSDEDIISYTPGPIRVPTIEPTSTQPPVSELPPVPQVDYEQERLEMIEIKNDGTSGHLTHNLP